MLKAANPFLASLSEENLYMLASSNIERISFGRLVYLMTLSLSSSLENSIEAFSIFSKLI
jgi:hypothetical protein